MKRCKTHIFIRATITLNKIKKYHIEFFISNGQEKYRIFSNKEFLYVDWWQGHTSLIKKVLEFLSFTNKQIRSFLFSLKSIYNQKLKRWNYLNNFLIKDTIPQRKQPRLVWALRHEFPSLPECAWGGKLCPVVFNCPTWTQTKLNQFI
jgi:hypothetical protein